MRCQIEDNLHCVHCGRKVSALDVIANCNAFPQSDAHYRRPCLAGSELKALLHFFGISSSGGCSCTHRAAIMDANGCDWSEANINEIVGWLREAAEERGLPFLDAAGRLLVRRAIHNARKAEAKRASEEASQAAAEGPAA
jgi:hypothetical protein